MTGFLAAVVFILMSATGVARSAAKHRYRIFLLVHHCHWFILPLMFVHCWKIPYRLAVLSAISSLVVLNWAMQRERTWQAPLTYCRTIGGGRGASTYLSFRLGLFPLMEGECWPHLCIYTLLPHATARARTCHCSMLNLLYPLSCVPLFPTRHILPHMYPGDLQ